jgi:hypothetical protein
MWYINPSANLISGNIKTNKLFSILKNIMPFIQTKITKIEEKEYYANKNGMDHTD